MLLLTFHYQVRFYQLKHMQQFLFCLFHYCSEKLQYLDSYNAFFNKGIKEIFKNNNPLRFFKELDEESQEYRYQCDLYFGGENADKIYYGKPIIYDRDELGNEREHYMYPNEARLRNMTYGFTIHYDIDVKFTILLDNDGSGDGVSPSGALERAIMPTIPLRPPYSICFKCIQQGIKVL